MFRSARIKLTAWYLVIIMSISLTFSAFVYIGVSNNTKRALEGQRKRFERQMTRPGGATNFLPMGPMIDVETLEEIRQKTLSNLILINSVILFASGTLGYLLAGRTLKPIETMVGKQKRFVSDAAHEIKTPLTAMKAELEVTLRDKKLDLQTAKDTIASTIEEVDVLHRFTTRLLKQSKYQNGAELPKEEIRLNEHILKVVKTLRPLAKEKGIEIRTDLQNLTIMGEKEALGDLFTNLIENAIKYNKEGEPVEISSHRAGNFLVTEIKDNGIGISEKDISNIFDPFYRSDQSRAGSKSEGFGLGLAISKEIVERHKGKIEVESVLDSGTKFTVKLPMSSQ